MLIPDSKENRHRFGIKVQHDLVTGCHEWVGAKTTSGYGIISSSKKRYLAHRVAYEWTYGPIEGKQIVQHSCDNPMCVNAMHLSLGKK